MSDSDKIFELQQALMYAWAANEDLRRRNGELSVKLHEVDEDAFDEITPGNIVNSRTNLIAKLLTIAADWRQSESTDEDMIEAIDDVSLYLDEWHDRTVHRKEIQRKAAKARNG